LQRAQVSSEVHLEINDFSFSAFPATSCFVRGIEPLKITQHFIILHHTDSFLVISLSAAGMASTGCHTRKG